VATKAITITAVNDVPVLANAIAPQAVTTGSSFSFTVPLNTFSDREGNALTYSVTSLPAGLSYNAGTRTIAGTPTAAGTSTISVIANDGVANGTAHTFQLVVSAPVVVEEPPPPPPPPPTACGDRDPAAAAGAAAAAAGGAADANGDARHRGHRGRCVGAARHRHG